MKVQPCSVHQLPPKTSSVINLHTKKKNNKNNNKKEIKKQVVSKRSGLPELGFLYNIFNVYGGRLMGILSVEPL